MLFNLPYYNINKETEYQYSYLLHILVRITGLSVKNKITKDDFMVNVIKWGVAKRTAYRIWNEGAYKNKFIKYVSDNRDYLYITGRKTFELFIEKVPEMYYKQIKGLSSLKDFLHYAFLGKNGIKDDEGTLSGKGLNTIARQTNSSIQTICNRNKRCINKFGLEKKNRFGVYNNLLIRLTNTYLSGIRIVKNKYYAVILQVRKTKPFKTLASLFKTLHTKTDKRLSYAPSEYYEYINAELYPKFL